ncbi:pantothenate synthetase [Thermodesulfomicrobium sp. WS]|uniref:pantoate--beta-alanine ligase n=1 Tax=Thermodesulfomicrobium sp. WS TaxID=3004129 RepID=UPI002491D034|nr:pantoate--beta-alanine ligase [Thermodesulfomicrobium sp. WS]BDV01289.1 pantothenate synthetase [Thermodesulfomicrobium sp. WS]
MKILRHPDAVREEVMQWRCHGQQVGFVPTMGYWHAGHVSLLDAARQRCSKVVASIFVNPTQFGPNEDLERYPRNLENDLALAQAHGVDLVFCPQAQDMYTPDHDTWVEVPHLSQGLCGASRPGHFRGVATVVTKLFWIVQPHVAFFGEKDWQQLAVIRAMVRHLSCPVEIVGCPTVREPDGLAMSSRNVYLTAEERAQAPALFAMLQNLRQRVAGGERNVDALKGAGLRYLAEHLPLGRLDYLEIVHPDTLVPRTQVEPPTLAAVALFLGKARLIDNLCIG